jgi:hypothetical protein
MPDHTLTFKTKRGYQTNLHHSKRINEPLRLANELKVTRELGAYIDRINSCGGYVLVTVGKDGKTFDNKLMGCDEVSFTDVIDMLSAK